MLLIYYANVWARKVVDRGRDTRFAICVQRMIHIQKEGSVFSFALFLFFYSHVHVLTARECLVKEVKDSSKNRCRSLATLGFDVVPRAPLILHPSFHDAVLYSARQINQRNLPNATGGDNLALCHDPRLYGLFNRHASKPSQRGYRQKKGRISFSPRASKCTSEERAVEESAYLSTIFDMSGVFLSKECLLSNLRAFDETWRTWRGKPESRVVHLEIYGRHVLQHSKETVRRTRREFAGRSKKKRNLIFRDSRTSCIKRKNISQKNKIIKNILFFCEILRCKLI